MPDLVDIQGNIDTVRSLTGIPNLTFIPDVGKLVDVNTISIAAFADAGAVVALQALGLIVTVVKSEADYNADLAAALAAVNDTPYDFGGNV